MKQAMTVNIRPGWKVRPEALQLQGKTFVFRYGWEITKEDSSIYVGETAMIPADGNYPADAPAWIASGDLVTNATEPA